MSECLRMRLTHATPPLHASVSRELLEYLFPYIGRNPLLVNLVSRLVTSLTRACKFASWARALRWLLLPDFGLRSLILFQIISQVGFMHARAFRPAGLPIARARMSFVRTAQSWIRTFNPIVTYTLSIHSALAHSTCKHVVAHPPTRANLTRASVCPSLDRITLHVFSVMKLSRFPCSVRF